MKEIWKDIEGYEGLYQVSNRGTIKSLERTIEIDRKEKTFRRVYPEIIRKQEKNKYRIYDSKFIQKWQE